MSTSVWSTSQLNCKFDDSIKCLISDLYKEMNFRKRVDDMLSTTEKKLDTQKETLEKLQNAFQQAQIKTSLNQSKS